MESNKEARYCEHPSCSSPATERIRSHGFGKVSFAHYYCEEHYKQHISSYKLEPQRDIKKL